MNQTSILPYLQQRSISLGQLISSSAFVSTYKGQWQSYLAAVKILPLDPGTDYQRMERECHSMIRLQHPNIMKIYDCFWCSDGQRYYLVIAVEWCNKDVVKDMQERRNAEMLWEEGNLWLAIGGLVSALTYMQREGFAHRDIKPQNLFVVSESLIKIGEFSSGRFVEASQSSANITLIGTPFFLSPLLKQTFLGDRIETTHNAFKSDVYSLGLTLILMITQHDQDTLAKAFTQSNSLWAVIQAIPYSESLKNMLWWMLQYEESDRCDFIELSQWLESIEGIGMAGLAEPNNRCMKCGGQIGSGPQKVTLECDPTHQFCSQQCFDAFLHECAPACPRCFSPISSMFQHRAIASVVDFEYSSMHVNLVNCLLCRQQIDMFSSDIEQRVVRLSCEPSKHIFCTTMCFESYKRLGNTKCPMCKVVLNQDISRLPMQSQRSVPNETREEARLWMWLLTRLCNSR